MLAVANTRSVHQDKSLLHCTEDTEPRQGPGVTLAASNQLNVERNEMVYHENDFEIGEFEVRQDEGKPKIFFRHTDVAIGEFYSGFVSTAREIGVIFDCLADNAPIPA